MRVAWLGSEWDMVEADEMLVAEQIAIEKHLDAPFEELTPMQTVMGMVYVTIRRALPQFSWRSLEGLTRTEFDAVLVLTAEEQARVDAERGDADPPAEAPPGAVSVPASASTSSPSASSTGGTPETSSD